MGILTEVAANGAFPTVDEKDKQRIVDLGAQGKWNVTDGDSLTNVDTGQQVRVKGHGAPEIGHGIYEDGELTDYKYGEVGGDYAKDVFYEVLNNPDNGFTLGELNLQEQGGGAGKRYLSEIRNKDGQDINSFMLSKGLSKPSAFATQSDYDDYVGGQLRREIYGDDDGYGALRAGIPQNNQAFKQTALNTSVITSDPMHGSDFYSGVAFKKVGENDKGFAINPLKTAFGTAWHSSLADFGGALNSLGELTESEWLKEKGDTLAYVNDQQVRENPFQRVQSLGQVAKESDTFAEYMFNGAEWLGVNTAAAIPYLGLLATGVVTGGAAAAVGAGTFGIAAASAIPSAALHTGNIWREIDVDQRTPNTAAVSIAMGTAAGAIDILALKGLSAINTVVKPSQLLSKEGRFRAVQYIKKEQGLTTSQAWRVFNDSVEDSTKQFLKYGKNITSEAIQKQRVLQDVVGRLTASGATEASTEVLQELITYSTAKAINNEVVTTEDLLAQLADDLGDSDSELREILLNAAAAGGAIGGVFSSAGILRDKVHRSRLAANLEKNESDKDLSPIARSYFDNKGVDFTIEQSQQKYSDRTRTPMEGDNDNKNLFKDLNNLAQADSGLKRIIEGRAGLAEEGINQTQKFYKEELLRSLPERAFQSQAVRNLYSYVSGTRGTHAGQSFERSEARSNGILRKITNPRDIGNDHGFDYKSERFTEDFSDKMYKFGEYVDGNSFKNIKATKPNDLTLDQLIDIGIFNEGDTPTALEIQTEVRKFNRTMEKLRNRARMQKDAEVKAYENNVNDSERVNKVREGNLVGWWWKHRDESPQRIRANRKGFEKIVADAVRNLKKTRILSQEETEIYKNPEAFAKAYTDFKVNGVPLAPEFSLGKGKLDPNAVHSRTLNLSQQPGIEPFLDRNIFRTLDNASQDSVRKMTHMNYFGEDNVKLDMMFGDARKELAELGFPEHEIIEMLKKAALGTQGIIDASQGNYNVIQNKTLDNMQKGVLTWTGFIGMSLSAPASLPEFMAIGVGLRDNDEFKKLAQTTGTEFYKGIGRVIKNAGSRVAKGKPRLENEFYDLQQKIGIPQDSASLSKKFGTGEEVELGGRVEKLNDFFYWMIGLQGMTSLQRTVATSTGLDYIRNRAEFLINVPLDSNMTAQQLDAYRALSELGIDVDPFVKNLSKLKQAGENQFANSIRNLERGIDYSIDLTFEAVQKQVEIGLQAFVNTRIQAPGAANRPLLLQDPHFRLLTQFNGFISAVTTTLVPKIWNDELGRAVRRRNPSLGVDTFGVILAMVLLGGVGQWLKDMIKFGEPTPYLEGQNKFIQRAFTSSGVFGQGEKLLDLVAPLYPQRGEGIAQRVVETGLGSVGRQGGNIIDLLNPEENRSQTAGQETLNDALKFVPFVSNATGLRQNIVGN